MVSTAISAGCCTTRYSIKIAAEITASHLRRLNTNNLLKSHSSTNRPRQPYSLLHHLPSLYYSSPPSSSYVLFIALMLLHFSMPHVQLYGQLERRQSTLLDDSRTIYGQMQQLQCGRRSFCYTQAESWSMSSVVCLSRPERQL